MRRSVSSDCVQVVIDQHVIVSAVISNLFGRVAQPPFDDRIGILTARSQPLFQNLAGRSQDKNRHRLWNLTLQLSRTLDVDVEYQVGAAAPVAFSSTPEWVP